jgi:type I restriction enzyme M protein
LTVDGSALKQTKLLENDKELITKDELGSWLWGAADILRGAVSAEDYGEFILPLLFYKRLSDVYAFE